MRIHLITIGKPKLQYAQAGWDEYLTRLKHYHTVRVTHLADKFTDDATKILQAADGTYKVGMIIEGTELSSDELAGFLKKLTLDAREASFIIGGPDGLPQGVIDAVDYKLSLSKLTLPHDLAMVTLTETLYRASTINAGIPYHK
jgi:23S rRNA (pseudouridine1915-N3)-methyltransferase